MATPELWEDRLHEAVEAVRLEMEERLRAKDEMLARVSHELRTPLTSIIGFCHMLLHYSGDLAPAQRSYVQKVLKNASVLLLLLNNVLDLARMQHGSVSVSREQVDLTLVVNEAVETIEPQTWEKELALTTQLEAGLSVVTDRLKLKQIIINLLSNAVRYTDRGGVVVATAATHDGVHITVQDTGVGIPPAELERIFEPYVQVDPERARGTASTGLGLAISQRLADLLHVRLTVQSQVGVGSCFSLWVPAEPAPPAS